MKNTYTHKTLRSICKVSKLRKRSTNSLDSLWDRIDYQGREFNKFREYLLKIERILDTRDNYNS